MSSWPQRFDRKFQGAEVIKRADEPSTSLFLIEQGSINYYIITHDGHQILLRRLVPGDVFGVGSLLSEPTGYIGTAQAISTVEVLAWDHRSIRRLVSVYP